MRNPIPLKPGDTVALTAPSSPVPAENLEAAIASIEMLGLHPVVMDSCRMSYGYLAGADRQRAWDLNQAFANPEIKGIFCLRGGYGTMRILPMLDLSLIRENPKIFVGYSDITALHTVFNQKCNFITFHGPMPNTDYRKLDDFTLNSLKSRIFSDHYGILTDRASASFSNPPDRPLRTLIPGNVSGTLTGGNLSLIAATLGTPYEIDTCGRILFLEEVGERPYRLDKMLTSLALAGKFRDCAGILLGAFVECDEPDHDTVPSNTNIADDTLTLDQIIEDVILPWGKPTLANLQVGHLYPQSTLPLGAPVHLSISE